MILRRHLPRSQGAWDARGPQEFTRMQRANSIPNSIHCAVTVLLSIFVLALGVCAQDIPGHSNLTRVNESSGGEVEGAGSTLHAIVASGRLENLRWPNFSDYRP